MTKMILYVLKMFFYFIWCFKNVKTDGQNKQVKGITLSSGIMWFYFIYFLTFSRLNNSSIIWKNNQQIFQCESNC